MRQGDGSDLLGPGDPRNSDIGILYVESRDSRQDILTAISTQELQGRKQIAIVLPEQGKAFRQPVDFDGLKNMRRQLKAQLIFIAPSGPGPAEFARQRRFPVYSSLETFRSALLNEGIPPANPRVKTNPGGTKRPGLLAFGSRKSRTDQQAPQVAPPTPRQSIAPIPPTPRIQDQQGVPSTPREQDQIEDMKTAEIDQAGNSGAAGAAAAGAAAGMLAAGALEGDDDDMLYAPPAPPATPGPVAPIAQGSATPTGPAVGPVRSLEPPSKPPQDSRAAPDIIVFPTATPAATPKTTGKMSAVPGTPGRGSGTLPAAQGPKGRGTGKLPASPANAGAPASPGLQDAPGPQNQPGGRNGGSGKMAAVGAGATLGAAAMTGVSGSAGGVSTATSAGAPSAVVSGTGGPGTGQRPAGLTPLPPPYSRRSRRRFWRRTVLLLVLLLLLSGALVFGIFAAQGKIPGLPGSITASVTITPASKLESDNYLLEALPNGTPNPAQRQVGARLLTQTSGTSTATGNATGSIAARPASGFLTFQNVGGSGVTIGTTILTGADGVQIKFNGPVFIPTTGSPTVTGYAVNSGAAGNIRALDIDGHCCAPNVFVKNLSAFSGGQDAQPNSVIQQSDIDKAAQPLLNALSQRTSSELQKQVKNNERTVDTSFQCKPTVHPSVTAGTVAKTVTVTVQVTCTEEVYDFAAAQSMATGLLQTKAQNDPDLNTQYVLDGKIVTSVLSATVVTAQGQVSLEIQAQGLWVYQFTDQMQQNIKKSLVKLSKAGALNVLQHNMGVAAAKISISNGDLMPANPSDITLTIQTLPGIQASPSGTSGNSPTVLPTGPTPTPTPVNGLGGS